MRSIAPLLLLLGCGGYRSEKLSADSGPELDSGPPHCEPGEERAGCPCHADEAVVCYGGPDGTRGVGPCGPGLRDCVEGRWTDCAGEVLPREELCNGVDDDCDGETDEGFASECGDCDPGCEIVRWGHEPGDIPFDPEDGTCVALTDEGDLVLDRPRRTWVSLFVPNTVDGTLSRIDTVTREEEARYRTGPNAATDSPSRTSVDWMSGCFVANRAFGRQSSVAKFSIMCRDADGDGVVETSTGRDDVLPFGEDECLDWHVEVGEANAVANALAVEAWIGLDGVVEEYVWVGLANAHEYRQLDAEDGSETGARVDTSPCAPHGAAIDADGNLWSACGDSHVLRFDVQNVDDRQILDQPGTNEGIALDQVGRVWTGGTVSRFDPARGEWTQRLGLRGHGVAPDRDRFVWVGACELRGVDVGTCRVDQDTFDVTVVDAQSKAIAIDVGDRVWGIPESGTLDVFDGSEEDPEVETVLDDCDGGPCLGRPEAYSDMVGFLALLSEPECDWRAIVPACPAGTATTWRRVEWEAEYGDADGIRIQIRAASSVADLRGIRWVTVVGDPPDEPPVPLEPALGSHATLPVLEVRVVFDSPDREARPKLHSLGIHRSCH